MNGIYKRRRLRGAALSLGQPETLAISSISAEVMAPGWEHVFTHPTAITRVPGARRAGTGRRTARRAPEPGSGARLSPSLTPPRGSREERADSRRKNKQVWPPRGHAHSCSASGTRDSPPARRVAGGGGRWALGSPWRVLVGAWEALRRF